MKMELIDRVMQRMMGTLDEKQLQELRMALVISLEGFVVEREKTELSTEVIDNWEYVRRFLQAFLMSGKSQETVKQYRLHLRILLDDLRKPVWEITESDIMEHLARQKYSRKLSNRYLNYKRAVFGSFFSWLRRKRYIRENPVELIEPIKYDSVIKKPFTDEEREKLRCACQHERDLAILDFLYSTAARVSEMTALNRQDIDWVGGECIVHGKGGQTIIQHYLSVIQNLIAVSVRTEWKPCFDGLEIRQGLKRFILIGTAGQQLPMQPIEECHCRMHR